MSWVQQEFDFDELPKERKAEKPKPALPRFDKPHDDNEMLLNCQYAYIMQGDENALNMMYKKGKQIAMKYIAAKAKKNRHIAELCYSDREGKAHNAITYIIARYLRVKDFAIQESFTAYLYLRIQHELFYQRKVDRIVDFVEWETYRGKKY